MEFELFLTRHGSQFIGDGFRGDSLWVAEVVTGKLKSNTQSPAGTIMPGEACVSPPS